MTTFYGAGTSFDTGASQFAGGGFMPSQGAVAGGSAQKRSGYDNRNQTLRALTIKQLHDAAAASSDDTMTVDGRDVTNVTVLARITAVEEQNLVWIYTLDDGTGSIPAKYWIPEQDDPMERQRRAEWRVGVYVRAHGHVNTFNREKVLMAFNIRLVTDHNEVTYHGLQVVFQHMHLTRGQAARAGAGAGTPGSIPAPPAFGATAATAGYNPNAGMTPVQNDILALFTTVSAGTGERGASIAEVVAQSGGRYTDAQVRAAVEELQNEGHLYSSIDDEHFKPCNAL